MDSTPNLALPYIMPAQAQKHVTHNDAIRILDALIQLAVLDRDLAAPPASPPEGARYIVAAAPTGAWAGHAGDVAAWQDGAWSFHTPLEGWLAWVADETAILAFDGSAWVPAGGTATVNPTALVGVNTTADAGNRLAVASPASLFTHAGGGHLVKINKATPADTASQLFQTNFSGRAEIGLAGDDDLRIKVSADGAAWTEALRFDRTTGAATHRAGARHTFQHDASAAGLRLLPAAGDPSGVLDGDVWLNGTSGRLRKREAGVTTDLDQSDVLAGRSGTRLLAVHHALQQAYAYTRGTFAAPRILRLMTIGDSVGTSMTSILAADWQRRMGGAIIGATATQPAEGQSVAGGKLAPLTIAAGSAVRVTNAYQYGHTGEYYDLVSGADVSWGTSGNIVQWTKAKVYYVKEPGAGTLEVFVNGVGVGSVSAASSTIELGVLSLDNANPTATSATGTSLRTTTTGGGVKVIYLATCLTNANGVWHLDAALGGLSLNQAMQHATGRAITQEMIRDFAPDVLWYEMKELADYTIEGLGPFTFEQRFDALANLIDAARPRSCDVVVVASNAYAPRANYDPGQQSAAVATRDVLRRAAGVRRYVYFDGYAALGEQGVVSEHLHGVVQPVATTWRGIYSAGATYALDDLVSSTSGPLYRFVNATPAAGAPLTSASHWRQQWIAYSAATTYARHDVVTSGGFVWAYINAVPGAGVAPPALPLVSNTHWQFVATYSDDGTHPSVVANAYRAALFNGVAGIAASPYGFIAGAVNETAIPSRLASGSVFSAGKAGQEMKVRTDSASVAYNWFLDVPQRCSVVETLSGKTMLSLWRYGNNNGSNLLQYAAYLGGAIALDGDGGGATATAGNAIVRAATVAGQAGSVEVWHRTNNVAGNLAVGALVADKWVRLKSYTMATVPAAATAGAGALIWVTDTTGGASTCVSTGSAWRMLGSSPMA